MTAGGALAGALLVMVAAGTCREPPEPAPRTLPAVSPNQPGPGDPPVVWVSGTLEEVRDDHLAVREGEGPRIRLQRLARGATAFYRLEAGAWRELREAEVAVLEVGTAACVEALLDGGTFLALRVFLGVACGPSG